MLWLSSEKKRLRRSLNTPDLSVALQKAEDLVLDCLQRERAGQKVMAASLAEVVDAWEAKHEQRLERGELRSRKSFERHVRFFRKHLDELYGLSTPVSAQPQSCLLPQPV